MTHTPEQYRKYLKRKIDRLEISILFAEETINSGRDRAGFNARELPHIQDELEVLTWAYGATAPSDKHAVTYPLVTRLELISNAQRQVVEYGVSKVWTSLQDEGRTLKIFKEVEDGF